MDKIGLTNWEVTNAFRTQVADKGPIASSNGWSIRLIYFYLLRFRSKLIREKSTARLPLSHWNYQTIDCIPLVKAPMAECPCLPA